MRAWRCLAWAIGLATGCASATRDASQPPRDAGAEAASAADARGDDATVDATVDAGTDDARVDARAEDVAGDARSDVAAIDAGATLDAPPDVIIGSAGCWAGEAALDTGLEGMSFVVDLAGRDGHYAVVLYGSPASLVVYDARMRRVGGPREVPSSTRVLALDDGFLLSDDEGYQRLGVDGAPSAPRVAMRLSGGFAARDDGLFALRVVDTSADAAVDGARVLVRLPRDGAGAAVDTAVRVAPGTVLGAGPEGVLRVDAVDGGRAVTLLGADGAARWSRAASSSVDLGRGQWDAVGRRWLLSAVDHVGPMYWDVSHAIAVFTESGDASTYGLGADHGGLDFAFALGAGGRLLAVDSSHVGERTVVSRVPGGVLETAPGTWLGVRVAVDLARARSVVIYRPSTRAGDAPMVARCYPPP